MTRDLKLSGNELLVYALIYSFTVKSENNCFCGSQQYISETLNIARQTANICINSLIKKKLIDKKTIVIEDRKHISYVSKNLTDSVKKADTKMSEKLTQRCQKTLHNNNIDNNINNYPYITVENF